MSDLRSQRAAVEYAVRHGESLPEIEAEIESHAEFSEEDRSALWLYAWSHLEPAVAANEVADPERAPTATFVPA